MKCVLIASEKLFEVNRDLSSKEDLQELESLANTLSFSALDKQILNLKKINPSTYYGTGQIKSINNKVSTLHCNQIIFNDDISPSQYKNIQKYNQELSKFHEAYEEFRDKKNQFGIKAELTFNDSELPQTNIWSKDFKRQKEYLHP